jgi:hypothetical protein
LKKFGYSLMYGKWAVIASIALLNADIKLPIKELIELTHSLVEYRLNAWKGFDEFIVKKNEGTKYFTEKTKNYELYYKVNILDSDIKEFFLK